jgi:sigma-B regulation protein RsbU (phosphoserine phosphatase)
MASDVREPVDASDRPSVRANADSLQIARGIIETHRVAREAGEAGDARSVLDGILDGVAPLVEHDAASIHVVGRRSNLVRHSRTRGCASPSPDGHVPFEAQGVIGEALASGKTVPVTGTAASDCRPCARSRLVVPVIGPRERVLGVLDVRSDRPGGYDEPATVLLEVYASAVAAAIETARLQADLVVKRRLDSDLALARSVMADLLPHNAPSLAGFDVAGAHRASLAVGGDYYEFIPLPEDRWGVVIADVVGKGIAAALLVAAIRASIASLVGHELAVRAIMRRANRFFHESVEEGRYVTLFYMVLDVPARSLLYVNAGHVPPVLVRATGEVELLEEGGVPLGLFQAPRYFEGHATLGAGDVVGLYTDGIVEQTNPAGEEYGSSRFIATLREAGNAGATELCSRVMQDVHRFGAGRQTDDRTLVIIRSNADSGPRPSPS